MKKAFILGVGLAIGLSFALETAVASPMGSVGSARGAAMSAQSAAAPIEKTQLRRRGGGVGPRVGVAAPNRAWRGGGWHGGGRRGISTGAAVGIGVGAAALGILGAAAAANAAPAPVYGECYIARRPMYDGWGNYIGSRRVRVCD
ncbi:MAG TPA: hypothetical protein PKA55_16535 [Rhodoblastus sp.]|nr:hypothetical protein [Rhodoblastus sp.]